MAVDDVSFSLKRGEIVGFLGPNGAGKTMTMRMKTITRHVQQTKLKKSKWLEDLRAPENGGEAVSEADEDENEEEGAKRDSEDDSEDGEEEAAEQPAAKASPAKKQTKDVTAYQFGFAYEL